MKEERKTTRSMRNRSGASRSSWRKTKHCAPDRYATHHRKCSLVVVVYMRCGSNVTHTERNTDTQAHTKNRMRKKKTRKHDLFLLVVVDCACNTRNNKKAKKRQMHKHPHSPIHIRIAVCKNPEMSTTTATIHISCLRLVTAVCTQRGSITINRRKQREQ
jgi:hypothetical protein